MRALTLNDSSIHYHRNTLNQLNHSPITRRRPKVMIKRKQLGMKGLASEKYEEVDIAVAAALALANLSNLDNQTQSTDFASNDMLGQFSAFKVLPTNSNISNTWPLHNSSANVIHTSEWEISTKNCGANTRSTLFPSSSLSPQWFYWSSVKAKAKNIPVEIEFIEVPPSWNMWAKGKHATKYPSDYLKDFFKIYNERDDGNAAHELIWPHAGFSGAHKYTETSENYYFCRSAMLTDERPCGICEISIEWEDFDSNKFNQGRIPKTYITITRFNTPLQELDSVIMKSLGDQAREFMKNLIKY